MATQVVDLTSSSDSEVEFCGTSPVKPPPRRHNISISDDDEFPDVDFGVQRTTAAVSSGNQIHSQNIRPNKEAQNIEFSYTTFTQINSRPVHRSPEKIPTRTQPSTTKTKQTKSKSDKAYEKALKAAQVADKKCSKAADCLKFITTHLDSRLLDSITGSSNILSQLEALGVKHKIESSLVPKSICWKRESIEHYVDDNLKVCSHSTITEEKDALIVITAHEFNLLAQKSLCEYYDKAVRSLKKDRITLIVFGLVQLLREQKTKGNRQFKERCSEKNKGTTSSQMSQLINEDFILSPAQLEEAKIGLMMERRCSIWPVESSDDMAKTIAHLTKAVAERPFKEDRLEQPFNFYAAEASLGGVRVAKDGQGLSRLWQQQIQQFPLAALETSQAIVSKYPTPATLVRAYQDCGSEKEAALLLQDIPVRRNAGPLSTTRKVGPELSKRMHKFMTSKDGEEIL